MIALWYGLLVFMLTVFVVLEGWDYGAGLLHFVVGRSEADRGVAIAAIGPLWIWHEVWLVAFGGMVLATFPAVLATAFAGFYLAFFLLLWSLILRGVAIEVRDHSRDALWRQAWDFVFAASNLLLALLIGVALGNVIRGVPLDASGNFTLPFFTDFQPWGRVGILDWYTVSVGVFVVALFAAHGASYLAMKTAGAVHQRSSSAARALWPVVLVLLLLATAETVAVRPGLFAGMLHRPAGWLAAIAAVAGGSAALVNQWRRREGAAFAGSCLLVASLMAAGAVGVFPTLLHSTLDPADSIIAARGAADLHGMGIALVWWPFAIALGAAYFTYVARKFRGKVGTPAEPAA
jgi:cytochrome bd ubiquinol oxidase subunit II